MNAWFGLSKRSLLNLLQGEEFYFVGEFSTPTVTMYESYIYGKYGLTLDELYQGRNAFFLTLQTLLNEHPETKDSYRLLFWRNISGYLTFILL